MTVKDLQSTVDYSFGVFTLSPYGNYGEPATISYRYDFPSEPTSYSEIEKIRKTTQWIAPEDGYFKFIGVAKSGDGGTGNSGYRGYNVSGGSGGSGGIVVSEFKLHKSDTVSLSVNGNITITCLAETATATAGSNGSNGRLYETSSGQLVRSAGNGGSAGQASGGNVSNVQGKNGNDGDAPGQNESASIASAVSTVYQSYSTRSGRGLDAVPDAESGTAAYVVVLRGNTNTPSPQ